MRAILKRVKTILRPPFRALRTASRILRGKHNPNYVLRRRIAVGRSLGQLFNHTVRYGPFKGMKLAPEAWWGADTASMLLGFYEKEVLDSLKTVPKSRNIFIDLGAANGYYGIGVLVNRLFDFSYCFERSPVAQALIWSNAKLNGVQDRVKVLGTAERGFWKAISHPLRRCVLFVDIEGAEFELLDDSVFQAFRESTVFIELHEWFYPDGVQKLRTLRARAERHFRVSELTTSGRDLSTFPELTKLSDDDRWVICSEGRGQRMTWWRLDPSQEGVPA